MRRSGVGPPSRLPTKSRLHYRSTVHTSARLLGSQKPSSRTHRRRACATAPDTSSESSYLPLEKFSPRAIRRAPCEYLGRAENNDACKLQSAARPSPHSVCPSASSRTSAPHLCAIPLPVPDRRRAATCDSTGQAALSPAHSLSPKTAECCRDSHPESRRS